MKLTPDVKIILGVTIATIVILFGGIYFLSKGSTNSPSVKIDQNLLIKPNSHKISSDSAKLSIVEFGDYQCPACGAAHPVVKRVLSDYKDKVNFVFRNFAFLGQESTWAAEAAECSAEQGKFWEYHDYLYEHQSGENKGAFSKDHLKDFAKFLGLKTDQFNSCLDSDKYSNVVSSDLSDGQKAGVNSTPTFFINGQKNVGVLSYEQFKNILDAQLK